MTFIENRQLAKETVINNNSIQKLTIIQFTNESEIVFCTTTDCPLYFYEFFFSQIFFFLVAWSGKYFDFTFECFLNLAHHFFSEDIFLSTEFKFSYLRKSTTDLSIEARIVGIFPSFFDNEFSKCSCTFLILHA